MTGKTSRILMLFLKKIYKNFTEIFFRNKLIFFLRFKTTTLNAQHFMSTKYHLFLPIFVKSKVIAFFFVKKIAKVEHTIPQIVNFLKYPGLDRV